MRISDWSSDVCSSDLSLAAEQHQGVRHHPPQEAVTQPSPAAAAVEIRDLSQQSAPPSPRPSAADPGPFRPPLRRSSLACRLHRTAVSFIFSNGVYAYSV